MIRQIIISLIGFTFLAPGAGFAQTAAPITQDAVNIEELIKKAAVGRREYIDAFKDLNAEETQRVEEYDDKGVKKRREIVSDLIIYQSPLDAAVVAEYRNLRVVDGTPVSGRDQRAEKLFTRLAKASSLKKELESIDREGLRYDLNASFSGYTLHQALPLDDRFTAYFRFTAAGSAQIDGHEVAIIDYQQVSPIPNDGHKLSPPAKLKGAETRYRGRLWLDRDTLRLRREHREWTITHPSLKSPLVFVRYEFEYSDSRFGILTPIRITMSSFPRGRDRADGTPELLIGHKVTYTYGPFSRFEVTQEFKPGI